MWPPTGIALAAYLLLGYRVWPAILVGAFLVNVTTEGSPATSLGIAIGNTLEGLVGAYLVNRFAGGQRVFERAPDIFKYAALALLSTVVSATIGVASLLLGGFLHRADFGPVWLTWWLGDAAGALVLTPALVLWSRRPESGWWRARGPELALLLAATVLTGDIIFGTLSPDPDLHYPLTFLCMPPLVWAAFRFGPREAATVIVVISAQAIHGTLGGVGPFVMGWPNASLLLLQAFMATTAMTIIPMAAIVVERRRIADALRHSEGAYRHMFEQNPHPMWITDRETFAFLAVNDATVARYGYRRDEFRAMTIMDIRPPEEIAHVREAMRDLRRGVNLVGLFQHRTKDGRLLDVEISAHPLEFAGRPAALVLAYDVTDRKRAEEAKDTFLATLSHELRTPLNAILGWVVLLRSERLDQATSGRALQAIERNARLQAHLVEDLLDVSRIVTGKLHVETGSVALAPVIEAAIESVRTAAKTKNVAIRTDLDAAAGPVSGDAARLQQAIWNLVSNAVKFTPSGGQVVVRLDRDGVNARIQVSDTGKGVSADFLPRIFERFSQAETGTTREHGGLGIGLALVRSIVELHGGTVSAESPGENRGTTFTIRLPAAPLRSARDGIPARAGRSDDVLHGVRVLVVDDEPDARELATVALARSGADVTAVASAEEALEALGRLEPDVMLVDLAMPGADGYDFIRTVRALAGALAHIPAAAWTAHARSVDREQALAAGYQHHLVKPIEPDELVAAVAGLLGRAD